MKKRTIIDEDLCRKVQLLIKGGASMEEAAKLTETSAGTIGRIKAAGYDIEKFNENKEKRRVEERKQKEGEEQIPGQMQLSFPEDPDEAFDRYVKEILETMNRQARIFQDGMKMIEDGMKMIEDEKKELENQRKESREQIRRLHNIVGIIQDALEEIRNELIV